MLFVFFEVSKPTPKAAIMHCYARNILSRPCRPHTASHEEMNGNFSIACTDHEFKEMVVPIEASQIHRVWAGQV
jgi:hypothetical protein